MSEEEQLAIALALSQGNTSGGGGGGSGGGGSGGGGGGGGGRTQLASRERGGLDGSSRAIHARRPGLSAAEQEELLLAQSTWPPACVTTRSWPRRPSCSRCARGTASTLVGLTPEEEMELAMLKSKIAHEQPELNSPLPRADAAAAEVAALPSAFGGGDHHVHSTPARLCSFRPLHRSSHPPACRWIEE